MVCVGSSAAVKGLPEFRIVMMCGTATASSPRLAVVMVRSGSSTEWTRMPPVCVTGTMNGRAELTT
jgi:hypothetical protein